jgi:hypothetical protein
VGFGEGTWKWGDNTKVFGNKHFKTLINGENFIHTNKSNKMNLQRKGTRPIIKMLPKQLSKI